VGIKYNPTRNANMRFQPTRQRRARLKLGVMRRNRSTAIQYKLWQKMYPSVVKVSPKDDYEIYIEFDNDECGKLNMKPYLDFGVFKKIKDPKLFSKVRVSFDTIEWPNGIDLDPKFVYDKCVKEQRITSE
jgi:hypothetical protein